MLTQRPTKTHGPPSHGFKMDGFATVPDQNAQDMANHAVKRYNQGASSERIATELNDLGYRNSLGREWKGDSVSALVNRWLPIYMNGQKTVSYTVYLKRKKRWDSRKERVNRHEIQH